MATLTTPIRPHGSRAEQELIRYLEGMRQESRIAKEQTDLQDADAQLDAVRGRQVPPPRGYPAFSLNLLADQVQRQAGLAPDARPMLEVVSGTPTNHPEADHTRDTNTALAWKRVAAGALRPHTNAVFFAHTGGLRR